MAKEITPRDENYSQWYNDIVRKAGLAEHSAVRGCMVIKPYGYAIWELMRDELDRAFKATGHVNAYFPLFIPKSYLSREAKHVDGFAKECAVVTHHRLMNDPDGDGVVVDPDSKLEEELIIRPTSETIIWDTYRNWIQSYRDLPLLINQWANVVRWEMRTRLFLRTAEFLWQEGHTAHATRDEAIAEAEQMHEVYARFCEDFMGMPVIKGRKTEHERFAGADDTYCIEALMQDGKALQAGTSHFLGQNFAKAFDVKYMDEHNKEQLVWATSWGVTTRLIGGLIMTHSDDDGLVLPPRLAPTQVVIVPIPKPSEAIDAAARSLMTKLQDMGIRVQYDSDAKKRPGFKFAEHEMKGVPVRVGIGQRDLDKGMVEVARRDTKMKESVAVEEAAQHISSLLDDIQGHLLSRAQKRVEEHTTIVQTWDEFMQVAEESRGYIVAHWDGTTETEKKIRELTKCSIRCIPLEAKGGPGKCVFTGEPSSQPVIFAKAY